MSKIKHTSEEIQVVRIVTQGRWKVTVGDKTVRGGAKSGGFVFLPVQEVPSGFK